jgi:hypothetical protein
MSSVQQVLGSFLDVLCTFNWHMREYQINQIKQFDVVQLLKVNLVYLCSAGQVEGLQEQELATK